jgi:hypothetical protein
MLSHVCSDPFLVIIVLDESYKILDIISLTCVIYLQTHKESPFYVAWMANLRKYSATVMLLYVHLLNGINLIIFLVYKFLAYFILPCRQKLIKMRNIIIDAKSVVIGAGLCNFKVP